jgi:hypothetical protein
VTRNDLRLHETTNHFRDYHFHYKKGEANTRYGAPSNSSNPRVRGYSFLCFFFTFLRHMLPLPSRRLCCFHGHLFVRVWNVRRSTELETGLTSASGSRLPFPPFFPWPLSLFPFFFPTTCVPLARPSWSTPLCAGALGPVHLSRVRAHADLDHH